MEAENAENFCRQDAKVRQERGRRSSCEVQGSWPALEQTDRRISRADRIHPLNN